MYIQKIFVVLENFDGLKIYSLCIKYLLSKIICVVLKKHLCANIYLLCIKIFIV